MDGEIRDLSKNIAKDLSREGSEKEGVEVGLCGLSDIKGGECLWSGGESAKVKAGGISGDEMVCVVTEVVRQCNHFNFHSKQSYQ